MNLLLFTGAYDKETFDTHINKLTGILKQHEEITVLANELIERIGN